MAINITQIAAGDTTIVIVVVNKIPYKRTFTDETAATEFTEAISIMDGDNPEDVEKIMAMLKGTVTAEFKQKQIEEEKAIKLRDNYKQLFRYGIEEINGSFYMIGGPKISMPKRLVDEFVARIDRQEETEPLMNFWKLCLLNPDAQARQDLFKFLQDGKIEITKAGLFVSYRSITKTETKKVTTGKVLPKAEVESIPEEEFEEAVVQSETTNSSVLTAANALQVYVNEVFTALRKSKKSTNVYVWLVGDKNAKEYCWTKTNTPPANMLQLFGVLKELHEKFAETPTVAPVATTAVVKKAVEEKPKVDDSSEEYETDPFKMVYTDDHSKTMEIRMLQEVRMPRENCDNNHNKDCSFGLHVGTESFVRKGSFGTVGVKVLINPRNVVSVPYSANTKMRVCAYFPYEFIEWDKTGHPKVSDSSTFDYAYVDYDMNEMQKAIMNLTIEELERQIIIPVGMSIGHLGKLVRDIADDIVRNRVIKIG